MGDKVDTFAIIKLGNLKIVGSVENPEFAKVGAEARLVSCGVSPEGAPFFRFRCGQRGPRS